MESHEAFKIMQELEAIFEMKFFDNENNLTTKGEIWIKKLVKKGDFEKSYKATNKWIEGNRFKPVLADILVKPVKVLDTEPDPETKKHLERLENDPEYRERMRKKREELAEHFKDILENKGVKDDEHNSE